jgi:hypothetical protein
MEPEAPACPPVAGASLFCLALAVLLGAPRQMNRFTPFERVARGNLLPRDGWKRLCSIRLEIEAKLPS